MARIQPRYSGALGIAIGGFALWGASRMPWLTAYIADDKAGNSTINIAGATWSSEAGALAAVLILGAIMVLVLRKVGRRIVAAITALAAIGASWPALQMLTTQPDPARARNILMSGQVSAKASDPIKISSWAQVSALHVHYAGPIIALSACAIALIGSVLVLMRPGVDGAKSNKFERKATREEKLGEDLDDDPSNGRVMWDALDAGIDPTDRKTGA